MESWALATSRSPFAVRYDWASLRSLSSLVRSCDSSSVMIEMRSRLSVASDLSALALSMSASKLAIPEIPSRMRLRSMAPIWTMRVTSPCWTRLYPSAEILAFRSRLSNSVMEDLRSFT